VIVDGGRFGPEFALFSSASGHDRALALDRKVLIARRASSWPRWSLRQALCWPTKRASRWPRCSARQITPTFPPRSRHKLLSCRSCTPLAGKGAQGGAACRTTDPARTQITAEWRLAACGPCHSGRLLGGLSPVRIGVSAACSSGRMIRSISRLSASTCFSAPPSAHTIRSRGIPAQPPIRIPGGNPRLRRPPYDHEGEDFEPNTEANCELSTGSIGIPDRFTKISILARDLEPLPSSDSYA
jgi:hypothetical protein